MIFAICTGFTFPPFNVLKRSGLPFHVMWNSNCLQLSVNGPSAPMKNARSLFLESTIALRIHFPVSNKNKNKF